MNKKHRKQLVIDEDIILNKLAEQRDTKDAKFVKIESKERAPLKPGSTNSF